MKILIVEDEKPLVQSITSYLKEEGYLCEVAYTFAQASLKLEDNAYDCVLVDIGLPDGSGFELIGQMKQRDSREGILILTARDSLDDKVKGLELGADDYLTKPFHLSELNARIKSIIRRRNYGGNPVITFNEIEMNTESKQVFVNKQILNLTKKEYDLLIFFLANRERVVSRESIVEHLWGDEVIMADTFDFIYTHVKNLRRKILEKGGKDYLKTIYGIGYKFSDQ